MVTVMFDSDQGTKEYPGCVPDHVLTDHRQLLTILGLDLTARTSPGPRRYPADTGVVAGQRAGTRPVPFPNAVPVTEQR